MIKTEFAEPLWSNPEVPPQAIGTAEDVASLVATVCSQGDGGFMNGEIYQIHGGFPKL